MLTDPQVTKLGSETVTLPRTSAGKDSAVYRDPSFRSTAEGETSLELSISHNYAKRTRRTVRINAVKLPSSTETHISMNPVSMSAYVVIDAPVAGFSLQEQEDVLLSLLAVIGDENAGQIVVSATGERVIAGES